MGGNKMLTINQKNRLWRQVSALTSGTRFLLSEVAGDLWELLSYPDRRKTGYDFRWSDDLPLYCRPCGRTSSRVQIYERI